MVPKLRGRAPQELINQRETSGDQIAPPGWKGAGYLYRPMGRARFPSTASKPGLAKLYACVGALGAVPCPAGEVPRQVDVRGHGWGVVGFLGWLLFLVQESSLSCWVWGYLTSAVCFAARSGPICGVALQELDFCPAPTVMGGGLASLLGLPRHPRPGAGWMQKLSPGLRWVFPPQQRARTWWAQQGASWASVRPGRSQRSARCPSEPPWELQLCARGAPAGWRGSSAGCTRRRRCSCHRPAQSNLGVPPQRPFWETGDPRAPGWEGASRKERGVSG